jgi:hypothetical protein
MDKIVSNLINVATANYLTYKFRNHIWLINPTDKNWAISIYPPTKYLWYNYEFFKSIFNHVSLEIPNDSKYIKNWVQEKFGIEIGDNIHPDIFPGDYDWRKDFNGENVLSNDETHLIGELVGISTKLEL